jgi:hypothetical protein
MSWNKAFDHAADYWQDLVPEISNICIKHHERRDSPVNLSLHLDDMFQEPRSLDSSELSPSIEDLTTNIWTTDEDATLVEEAERNKFEWEIIAKSFPNVSAKQVKSRWKKIKREKVKNELTNEQDKLILSLYKTYGGNWKKISTFFDGISPNVIKNRYYTVLKPADEEEEKKDLPKNVIGQGKGLAENKTAENRRGAESQNSTPGTRTAGPAGSAATAGIDGLSEIEKRKKLLALYQKAMEIEKYIKETKSQIQDLVTKGVKK